MRKPRKIIRLCLRDEIDNETGDVRLVDELSVRRREERRTRKREKPTDYDRWLRRAKRYKASFLALADQGRRPGDAPRCDGQAVYVDVILLAPSANKAVAAARHIARLPKEDYKLNFVRLC